MNTIINFILKISVFFVGWILFPDIFQFRDFKAVIVTTLLIFVVSYLIMLIVMGFCIAIESEVMMVVACIVVSFLIAISILLVSAFYQGFHFGGGFIVLILTSVALYIFTVGGNNNE